MSFFMVAYEIKKDEEETGSVQYLQQKERPWHVDVNGHSHISPRKPWSSWSLSYQARG